MRCSVYYMLLLVLLSLSKLCDSESRSSSPNCKAWLVQSIPTDMPHLSHVSGVLSTGMYVTLNH